MVTTTTGLATSFITFTRTSNATVTDSNGFIEWAGHNLLTNSESFDASSWSRQGLSGVTANAIAAPNGTTTADKLLENNLNDFHYVTQLNVIDDSAPVSTLSVFARAAERQYLNLALAWGANFVAATFDLTNGITTSDRSGGTGASQPPSITPVGGGWYLCTLRGTIGTGGSDAAIIAISDSATPTGAYPQYTGTTGNGFHVWGAHLYRSDLGGMVLNPARGDAYYPTTPRNLLGYTESFDNAAWSKTNTTVTANTVTAPNGLLTADKLVETTANAQHYIQQSATVVANSVYTISVYLKAAERTYARVINYDGGSNFYGVFVNLANGTISSTTSGGSTVSTANSITPVGDGWYRVSVTASMAGATRYLWVNTASDASTISYAGDTSSGIYLWGAQLSDSASLDAYSPVYGAAVTSAAYYAPRLDYDPVTLAAKGLLVEEQRTNLLLNSATLSTQNATVTAVAHTLSFYGTGTVTLSGASTAGPLVGTGAYPNRVTLTFTPTAGTLTLTVTGSVTQAQLEAGSFATSYIPTGASTATRTADVASVSTQAFPYSGTAGSYVIAFTPTSLNNNYLALSMTDGTGSNRIYTSAGPAEHLVVSAGGVLQASIDGGTLNNNVANKVAAAFAENDFAVSLNGGAAATDTSGIMPVSITTMSFGNYNNASSYMNGWVRQVTYLPRRISNAELQSRSA